MQYLKSISSHMPNTNFVRKVVQNISGYEFGHGQDESCRAGIFQTDLKPQPDSRFLSIPAEIRLVIYAYVFAQPLLFCRLSHDLNLLLTCRLVNEEAVKLAFQQIPWLISTRSTLIYRPQLRCLGTLQLQLRHVEIEMRLNKIDATGPNNPFILTLLPLDILKITFSDWEPSGWRDEVDAYHKFISALLYRSSPVPDNRERSDASNNTEQTTGSEQPAKKYKGQTVEIYKHAHLQMKRRLEVSSWAFHPTHAELEDIVARMRAKEVIIRCKTPAADLLWQAFSHFNLLNHQFRKFNVEQRAYGSLEGGQTMMKQKIIVIYDEQDFNLCRIGESLSPVP